MGREDAGGGSLALGELLDEYGAELFADFLTAYRLDLTEILFGSVGTSRMAPRLILSLIENLPEGSLFKAQMQGGKEYREWTLTNWFMAQLINAVNTNSMIAANMPASKRKQFPMITGPDSLKPKKVTLQNIMGQLGGPTAWPPPVPET